MPNWVGDAVMTLPSLHLLSQLGFECVLYGRPWLKDLFSATPYRCEVAVKNYRELVSALRAESASQALLFPNSWSSALTMRLAGKEVVGYSHEGRGILLAQANKKSSGTHELETFYKLATKAAEFFGRNGGGGLRIENYLPVSDLSMAEAKKVLAGQSQVGEYWVLCPTATGKSAAGELKVWPHWIELSQRLHSIGKTLICCPGPGESDDMTALLPGVLQLDDLSLSTYSAVILGAEKVLANDTGPMHMAAAIGVPVLGIFGVTDPGRTSPWGGEFIGDIGNWPDLSQVMQRLGV